jgi:hypothetical protein
LRVTRLVVSLTVGLLLVVSGTATARPLAGTTLEREWLRELSTSHTARVAHSPSTSKLSSQIALALRTSDVSSRRIRVYEAFGALAPDVQIQTTNTAAFLRHHLEQMLRVVRHYPYVYVRVTDTRGVALDWYQLPAGGALELRPDDAGCSPIQAAGGGRSAKQPCPVP